MKAAHTVIVLLAHPIAYPSESAPVNLFLGFFSPMHPSQVRAINY